MIYLDVTSSCKSRINTGVQRIVRGIAKHLPEKNTGLEPLLWSPSHRCYCRLSIPENENLAYDFEDRFQHHSPETLRDPHPWSKSVRWLGQKFRRLSLPEVLRPGDLLLVPEIFQDSRIDFFNQLNLPEKVRRAAVFYDALGWSMPEFNSANDRSKLLSYLTCLARFQQVLCISNESEADLQRFWKSQNIVPTSTVTLPLPMPLTGARPPARENFAAKKILCVASLEDRKNHLLLFQACRELWAQGLDFELVLVGRSIPGRSDSILARMEDLKKEGRRLSWIQHIDDISLAEAYVASSFTVFPSIREGFGLPILESLWHGRPCVCGNNGALGEAAVGGGCHFVRQTDAKDLARGLRDLLENRPLYERLNLEIQHRSFKSWQTYAAEIKTALDK